MRCISYLTISFTIDRISKVKRGKSGNKWIKGRKRLSLQAIILATNKIPIMLYDAPLQARTSIPLHTCIFGTASTPKTQRTDDVYFLRFKTASLNNINLIVDSSNVQIIFAQRGSSCKMKGGNNKIWNAKTFTSKSQHLCLFLTH